MTQEEQTPQPPVNPTPKQPVGFDWKWFYFSLDGRIGRQPFWLYYVLPVFVLLFVVMNIISALAPAIYLACLVVGVFVGGKRCHDRGKSAWWLLIALIPFIGLIWWVVDLGILEGTPGENQYGPDPLK